jgi:1,4-alpha-glucan branching enzyme
MTPNDHVQKPIRFELLAPYNEFVNLLGSWDGWKETPMQRSDGGTWFIDIPLADGTYQYKFHTKSLSWFALGQDVTIPDPKAPEISLDSNENAIVHVVNGERAVHHYTWQHDDVPLPPNDQLVIYELHLADFRGGAGDSGDEGKGPGTFNGVIEKLDMLAALGINAIEFMPLNEWPGEHSWGYAQRSVYAVENSYGTPTDLCRLVDECHKRGIRVIHDAVFNHMESEAPLTKIDYEYWFYKDNPDEAALQFGPKFNYEKFDTVANRWPAREHVLGAIDFWVENFHIDGIRFDCTRGIKRWDVLDWFNKTAHARADFKPFITVAEHVPQDGAIVKPSGPMDAAWHENYYQQLVATVIGVPKDGRDPFNTTEMLRLLDGRTDGFSGTMTTIHYLDNHDHDRSMYLLGKDANTFDEAAFKRSKLGATLLLTSPGIPMLWMGQEVGQSTPKTLESQPIPWDLLKNPLNQALYDHYKALIGMRRANPALFSANYQVVADLPERGLIAFKRWNDAGNIVVVVANLRPAFGGAFEIGEAGLPDGDWHEAIYNYDVKVEGGRLKDELAEGEAKVYIKMG